MRPELSDQERVKETMLEGDAAFAPARTEGRAMTLEHAIERALAVESQLSTRKRLPKKISFWASARRIVDGRLDQSHRNRHE
jgi:hypothetical protein